MADNLGWNDMHAASLGGLFEAVDKLNHALHPQNSLQISTLVTPDDRYEDANDDGSASFASALSESEYNEETEESEE